MVQVCGFKAAGLTVKVCLRSGMLSVELILILRTVLRSRWHLQTIRNLLSRISDSSFLSGLRQTLGRLMVLGLGQKTQGVVTEDVPSDENRLPKFTFLFLSMMSYTNLNSKLLSNHSCPHLPTNLRKNLVSHQPFHYLLASLLRPWSTTCINQMSWVIVVVLIRQKWGNQCLLCLNSDKTRERPFTG